MVALQTENLLLAALPEQDRVRLSAVLRTVPLRHKQVLMTEGMPIDTVYFPNGGICSLTRTMEDGRIAEVGLMGREGVIGFMACFGMAVAPHDSMIQIPDPSGTSAEVMSRRDFLAEMSLDGAFRAAINRYMASAHAFTSISVACNALHTAEERCARWLLHAHDRVGASEFELSHEFLAMMLGVRRPTATIAAGMLQRAGLIHYKRGHMTISDRPRLEEASCECYKAIEKYYEGLLRPAHTAEIIRYAAR